MLLKVKSHALVVWDFLLHLQRQTTSPFTVKFNGRCSVFVRADGFNPFGLVDQTTPTYAFKYFVMSDQQVQYFRNKEDLFSKEGILIDAFSLWKLDAEQNIFVLEDEDQYITTPLDYSKFSVTT